ncbi:MAG: 5-formyltetrahydrofolate cyclo-ligase [Candidatus Melainabacteria bacterium]|nr:5-formyltetrahydrofolate cyclo-ligase [Candidatus Melainabacteria bacterium]
MDNNKKKIEYRSWAKSLRQTLDLKSINAHIEAKITKLDNYRSAKTVMSYQAKDTEVSLHGLFKDGLKLWFLPAISGGKSQETKDRKKEEIVVVPFFPDKTKLVKNRFNILEPEITDDNFFDQISKKVKLDLIFVPGLCFDKERNRLGFGAGFYDRFLLLNPNSIKIGCCPKGCLVDKLPVDAWDVKMDIIITD